jgi:hypothetical protein
MRWETSEQIFLPNRPLFYVQQAGDEGALPWNDLQIHEQTPPAPAPTNKNKNTN